MSDVTVANRYAEAIFQLGKERGTLETFHEELNVLRDVFLKNKELVQVFGNPSLSQARKKAFAREIFAGLNEDLLHTVYLLIERHRIDNLPLIAEQFEERVLEESGIARLEVYSAKPVDDRNKDELVQAFKKRLGKQHIQIENKIDPSLIGGLKVRVGNTIYDGSVRGKLDRLSQLIRTRKI
ncbi:F0F1 ATP synthase subunit delta [Aciduricibacillus chroicocephali]|uniref:ATP synthase subunit delta n=1 Tax=Aciduricibacillus chroicocephali TaxID=3054939 RepID=A0ABY9KUH1_9BACI|nr:F0F1 ATP synthase subunit delta [Bacillaceae bacterium 44XB]